MAIRIDLKRDLPKVRKQYAKVIEAQANRKCDYRAPCVIGAMVSPLKRNQLEEDGGFVSTLLRTGALVAPPEQHRDLVDLQQAFDRGSEEDFELKLKSLERKYRRARA